MTVERADQGGRPAVRDFTGTAGVILDWDVRPVYDFLFSLSEDAGSTDDLPPADRRWLTDARSSLPRELRASVGPLFESELSVQVASFAVGRPELRTARQFVDALRAAGTAELMDAIFCEAFKEPGLRALVDRVAAGDASLLPQVEALLPDWRRPERLALLEDPDATAQNIVALLDAWSDRFTEIEGRVSGILERDAEARAPDRASLRPVDLIERTTGGVRWLPEAGVRRVVLAPSYFSRPYNFLLAGPDWRFFGYPVADSALDAVDPLAPPPAVVRLHRALGDETRMRILKLLTGRDLYLTEIAQELDLSKPTIKHHLALLRSAGLVTVTEAGAVLYYSLRRQRLDDACTELKAFLD